MCTCLRMSRSLACPERRSVRPTAPDPGGRRALHTPHCCGVVLSATRRVFGTLASAEAGATLRRTERTFHEVAALDPRGVFGALSPGDTNLRVVGGFPHAVRPARPPARRSGEEGSRARGGRSHPSRRLSFDEVVACRQELRSAFRTFLRTLRRPLSVK